jgi:hypothetical protein
MQSLPEPTSCVQRCILCCTGPNLRLCSKADIGLSHQRGAGALPAAVCPGAAAIAGVQRFAQVKLLTPPPLYAVPQFKYITEYVGRCSAIAREVRFGSSVEGQPLVAIEISSRPGSEVPGPQVKYVGNIHGDEPSGRWACWWPLLTTCSAHANTRYVGNDMRSGDHDGCEIHTSPPRTQAAVAAASGEAVC